MEVLFERLGGVEVPTKLYPTDTGWIINSYKVEGIYTHSGGNGEKLLIKDDLEIKFDSPTSFNLQYNERALVSTGLLMHCEGHELTIRPLIARAWLTGVILIPGTIFVDYRKEIKVVIVNTSRQTQNLTLGDPIARVVPVKLDEFSLKESPVVGSKRLDDSLKAEIVKIDPFKPLT